MEMKDKKAKISIVSADWKDIDGLVDDFIKAIEKLDGYVYEHPMYEGSDTYGFIVSNKKLTKKQIKKFKFPDE